MFTCGPKCLPYPVPNVWCLLQRDSPDPDIIIRTSSEHCRSASMELWLTAVYGYKGPLLVGHGTTRKLSYIQTNIIRNSLLWLVDLEHVDCLEGSADLGVTWFRG